MAEKQTEYITQLSAHFEESGLESKIIDGVGGWQFGDTLMSLVPVTDTGENVLLQVAMARYSDDLFFINIYSTIVTETKNDTPELREMLNAFSAVCPVGAFGVIGKEVYHKYTLLFEDEDEVDFLVFETVRALSAISFIISANFKDITEGFLG